jgi:lipoprotein-releasing system permease protein
MFVALRYAFGKGGVSGRGDLSYVSTLALAGLVISIAVLVFVTSIVNGFERELRERLLNVLPHISAISSQGVAMGSLPAGGGAAGDAGLLGLAPVITSSGLVAANGQVRSAQITGIDQNYSQVSALGEFVSQGAWADVQQVPFGVAIGARLANQIGVSVGDSLVLLVPDQRISLAGAVPRQKRFQVVGIFASQSQLDASGVFISLADAQRLLRMPGEAHGVQGRLTDLFDPYQARAFLRAKWPVAGVRVQSWMTEFGTLYQAISVQKATLFLLFSLLIAVAAFNLVSGLIMIVEQRRGDIAILRSMGASRGRVLGLFSSMGVLLGLAGTAVGMCVGVGLGYLIPHVVNVLSQTLGYDLMSQYFISYLPVQILLPDLVAIGAIAVVTTFLASLYPAWRATQLLPSEVLANE